MSNRLFKGPLNSVKNIKAFIFSLMDLMNVPVSRRSQINTVVYGNGIYQETSSEFDASDEQCPPDLPCEQCPDFSRTPTPTPTVTSTPAVTPSSTAGPTPTPTTSSAGPTPTPSFSYFVGLSFNKIP